MIAGFFAAHALADDVYLTEADAPAAVFPDADRFERGEAPSTADLKARVARRLGGVKPTVWEPSYKIATAFRGDQRLGHAIDVEEIGKHRPITVVVGVDARGEVVGVAVMVYREAYGGEIRTRRFLDQYRGKSASDPLVPSQDIRNITGATLSARAVGRAVKKAIAVLAEVGDADSRVAAAALPSGSPRPSRAARVREAHYVMGTLLDVTVDAPSIDTGRAWIRQAVAEAQRLDGELSSFRPESDLSRLNRRAGSGFQRVSPDLYHLLELSTALSAASDRTFDVTVSPLVELWNQARRGDRRPSAEDLAAVRARVGSDKLLLRPPDEVELSAPGMALELGGIGKGYAADRLAEVLRRLGAASALVNFGQSSIVAVGPPAAEPPWPIWVRRGPALDGPLLLRDMALSTSASFAESGRVAGRRIGHIIDPRTGKPVMRSAQATVVAPSGAEAEAWSKALLIEPRYAFRALAARPGAGGLLFSADGERADRRFASLSGWHLAR